MVPVIRACSTAQTLVDCLQQRTCHRDGRRLRQPQTCGISGGSETNTTNKQNTRLMACIPEQPG